MREERGAVNGDVDGSGEMRGPTDADANADGRGCGGVEDGQHAEGGRETRTSTKPLHPEVSGGMVTLDAPLGE